MSFIPGVFFPQIAISSDVSSLAALETATLTFTLSVPSGDFEASDITVSGGALSNFQDPSGSGTTYTATFTPTADSTTNGVISVASNKFSSSFGGFNNDGSDSNNTVTLSVDTTDNTRPTIAISSDVTSLKAGETATLTFTLSEPSSNFNASRITALGGALSSFQDPSGSGTTYTATFTPTADSTKNGVISVASNQFSDATGNANNDGSDSNNTVTLSVDTTDNTRPTIAISSDVTSLKAGETATLTFTLSEPSSNFNASRITALGGALSSFQDPSGSGTTYTATFTPTADSTKNGVISVASNQFSDATGNANNDGSDSNNTVILSVDTSIPPTPTPTPEPESEPEDYELPLTINTIKGSKKDDDLIGTKQNDFIDGKKGDDVLTGSKGNDLLKGNKGDDTLKGSNGNDYLDGSKGTDLLIGGKGADVFQISKGFDTVRDFSIKQGDRIALDKKGKYTIKVESWFEERGLVDNVVIKGSGRGDNTKLFLQGVDYDDVIEAGADLFVQPI